ncbi:Rha family transcriptional regulator [Vibrio plantisponsor]|uniref:Rha family transcriptional regulator n=1 Tax=Vibrio plantisponsor TaxID=664643 RepID=UPI00370CA21A
MSATSLVSHSAITSAHQHVLTMSSKEIAEVVQSRHDSVKRTIERLKERGLITFTPSVENPDIRVGRPSTIYYVNKRDSYVVVAQLSPEFTSKLVDRWQELEASQGLYLPDFSNPAEAARAWAHEFEQKQLESQRANQAEAEVNRLQGVCNAVAAQFITGMTPPAFCKQLNGVNIQQVNHHLVSIGALIKTKCGFEPAAYYRDRYFKVSFEEHNGTRAVLGLTLKGAKWLYSHYINKKLPMKKDWDGRTSHILFADS